MKLFKKILRYIFIYIPVALIVLSLVWVTALKWIPVKYTPLMAKRSWEMRKDENFKTRMRWRPLEEISDNMILAVIASEDNKFLTHNGFDWKEIKTSIEDNRSKGKKLRGASTISQQTAKNVFLFPGRNWLRKGLEAYYTCAIEIIWGKRRIMEVYLNIAEMGKGIYGAEAAAAVYFSRPASRLNRYQASLLAAKLPSPLTRRINPPSAYMLKRSAQIVSLMYKLEYKGWNSVFKGK